MCVCVCVWISCLFVCVFVRPRSNRTKRKRKHNRTAHTSATQFMCTNNFPFISSYNGKLFRLKQQQKVKIALFSTHHTLYIQLCVCVCILAICETFYQLILIKCTLFIFAITYKFDVQFPIIYRDTHIFPALVLFFGTNINFRRFRLSLSLSIFIFGPQNDVSADNIKSENERKGQCRKSKRQPHERRTR